PLAMEEVLIRVGDELRGARPFVVGGDNLNGCSGEELSRVELGWMHLEEDRVPALLQVDHLFTDCRRAFVRGRAEAGDPEGQRTTQQPAWTSPPAPGEVSAAETCTDTRDKPRQRRRRE